MMKNKLTAFLMILVAAVGCSDQNAGTSVFSQDISNTVIDSEEVQ